jgi:hypothetical protein
MTTESDLRSLERALVKRAITVPTGHSRMSPPLIRPALKFAQQNDLTEIYRKLLDNFAHLVALQPAYIQRVSVLLGNI